MSRHRLGHFGSRIIVGYVKRLFSRQYFSINKNWKPLKLMNSFNKGFSFYQFKPKQIVCKPEKIVKLTPELQKTSLNKPTKLATNFSGFRNQQRGLQKLEPTE